MAASSRSLRRRSAWTAVGVAALLSAAVACSGGSGDSGNPGELFPDRANQYREDQEREIGDAAHLSGYTTTVTDASYDGNGTVKVSVRIENRDADPQSLSSTDWTLVSPDDTTYDAVRSTLPTTGQVGDTPVTGEVFFEVDPLEDEGDFYIQYKPDILDAARGIWHFQNP